MIVTTTLRRHLLASAGGLAMVWLPATVAQAQTAAAPDPSTASALEEVIVTARKREENIQSVPVAITALGAEEMRAKSVRTAYDLVANTPGLVIRGAAASRNAPEYFIRGQGASFGTPPGVILYFAESSLGGVGSSAFFDLSSVQVLKGPQGTLFGRSTTGGAILFTPTRPTGEFGGFVQAQVGNLAARDVTAAFTIPIIDDRLSVRIAAQSEQRDGYTRSLSTGQKQDERNRQAYRIGILARPVSWLENYTLLQETRSDEAPGSNVLLSYNANLSLLDTSPTGVGFRTVQGLCASTSGGNAAVAASCVATRVARLDALRNGYAAELARIRAGGDDAVRFTQTGITGPIDRARDRSQLIVNITRVELGQLPVLGDVSLKNIYATARTLYGEQIRSIGATPFEHGRNYTGVEFINGRYRTSDGSDFGDTYTEEIQLAGDIPNRLNWLLGYYYRSSENDLSSGPYFSSFNNAFTFPLDRLPPLGNHTADAKSSEKGIFGQATVDLSALVEGLHFTGGYRKTTSESSSAVRQTIFDPANGGSFIAGAVISPPFGFKESANSYTLTVDWQVNPDLLVYAAHRKGFKPGGINGIARTNTQVPGLRLFFDPETLKDYEIGAKALWAFNGMRGRTNVAAYFQDYTGLQRTEQLRDVNPPFATFTQTNNIGAAEIKGLELENLVQVNERLTLTLNYGYIDAKYTEYPGTIVDIAGVVHNLIDTPYTGTAKHQFTADARYRLPVDEAWGEVFASVQLYVQSGVWLDDSALNNPNFREGFQPGYENWNARLDWNNFAGRPVDVSFFVKNITDDTRKVAIANFLNNLGVNNAIYDEPRTYGVQVRVRFGANAN